MTRVHKYSGVTTDIRKVKRNHCQGRGGEHSEEKWGTSDLTGKWENRAALFREEEVINTEKGGRRVK